MKKLLIAGLLLTSVSGFAAWNKPTKQNFFNSFKKSCTARLAFFTNDQCNSWSHCATNLFEEAYPNFSELISDMKNKRNQTLAAFHFVGRACTNRVLLEGRKI